MIVVQDQKACMLKFDACKEREKCFANKQQISGDTWKESFHKPWGLMHIKKVYSWAYY